MNEIIERIAILSDRIDTGEPTDPAIDAKALVAIALSITNHLTPDEVATVLEEGAEVARKIVANRHVLKPQ